MEGNTSVDSTAVSSTAAAVILSALERGGVSHIFVNLGSDHPAFLAAFAAGNHPNLKIITCPNEMNALSAASGFAQISNKPAAVLVHVDCGTLGLAGAIHNVSKGRIPVMIFAGTVPITQNQELRGSRNEHIHWIQDVPDQRAIVRQYMRYDHEIRSPLNAAQIVSRALQIATSSPKGPVYLMASREVLEENVPSSTLVKRRITQGQPLEPLGLSPAAVSDLSSIIIGSKAPLIVTSYCGKTVDGFLALKDLAELCQIAVHENAPVVNNFPTASHLHQGHQWNGGGQLQALVEADVVIVVDSDVPWITTESRPSESARIFHLDVDPLKEEMTLWDIPCEKRWKCDSFLALRQIADAVRAHLDIDSAEATQRLAHRRETLQQRFEARKARLLQAEQVPLPDSSQVTVPFVVSRLREAVRGANLKMVGLNESTTNLGNVADHLGHEKPLSLLGSGGGSLGWYSGAAVGASLALQAEKPSSNKDDHLLVAFTGDGTWLFGVPASAYWMAMKYDTPYVTIVWNNGGWSSPQNACFRLNPDLASQAREQSLSERLNVAIDPSPAFGKIAEAAGNAWWAVVDHPEKTDAAISEAIRVVREERRSAVIEVRLKRI